MRVNEKYCDLCGTDFVNIYKYK